MSTSGDDHLQLASIQENDNVQGVQSDHLRLDLNVCPCYNTLTTEELQPLWVEFCEKKLGERQEPEKCRFLDEQGNLIGLELYQHFDGEFRNSIDLQCYMHSKESDLLDAIRNHQGQDFLVQKVNDIYVLVHIQQELQVENHVEPEPEQQRETINNGGSEMEH